MENKQLLKELYKKALQDDLVNVIYIDNSLYLPDNALSISKGVLYRDRLLTDEELKEKSLPDGCRERYPIYSLYLKSEIQPEIAISEDYTAEEFEDVLEIEKSLKEKENKELIEKAKKYLQV